MKNTLKTSIVIVISMLVGFYSAVSYSQIEIKQLKFSGPKIDDFQEDFVKEVIERVKIGYVEEKSYRELSESAANGILSSLDPHSSYLNEDALKDLQVQTKGEFGGLGIEITVEYSLIKVVTAIDDTPAFKVGIKPGDYITKVDGHSVIGTPLEEVVKKLRGKPGTKVAITILRKGEKEAFDKIIQREIIKVKAVRSVRFKDIGYIRISSFSEQAYNGIVSEINKLKKEIAKENHNKKLKGLVLDLRNNPGGLLDQAVSISDAFLNKDQIIVSISGRNKLESKEYRDENPESLIPNLPMVVLINEGSASASEIVAGALQDNKRAIIMGVKSFGKGSVQTIIPLISNSGALKMTTALYYTPSKTSIQAHGIEPDIIVTEAKITKLSIKKDFLDERSEASLKGHIEVEVQKALDDARKNQISEDNLELYDSDYQLARAVDLLRGINAYSKIEDSSKQHQNNEKK
jgi:carboxyl-terminal processing protease